MRSAHDGLATTLASLARSKVGAGFVHDAQTANTT